jgi:hypothetical protein
VGVARNAHKTMRRLHCGGDAGRRDDLRHVGYGMVIRNGE